MRAIPICLLPHTVLLKKPAHQSIWGSVIGDESVILTRVRLEGCVKRSAGGAVCGTEAAGVLYYDCRNSAPKNVVFSVGDLIEFGGREYAVTAVEWLCGKNGAPHHAEIRLV